MTHLQSGRTSQASGTTPSSAPRIARRLPPLRFLSFSDPFTRQPRMDAVVSAAAVRTLATDDLRARCPGDRGRPHRIRKRAPATVGTKPPAYRSWVSARSRRCPGSTIEVITWTSAGLERTPGSVTRPRTSRTRGGRRGCREGVGVELALSGRPRRVPHHRARFTARRRYEVVRRIVADGETVATAVTFVPRRARAPAAPRPRLGRRVGVRGRAARRPRRRRRGRPRPRAPG
jgi:hypothetical protein